VAGVPPANKERRFPAALFINAAGTAAATGRAAHAIINRVKAISFFCGGARAACDSFRVAAAGAAAATA